jgi:hypothetical protein
MFTMHYGSIYQLLDMYVIDQDTTQGDQSDNAKYIFYVRVIREMLQHYINTLPLLTPYTYDAHIAQILAHPNMRAAITPKITHAHSISKCII